MPGTSSYYQAQNHVYENQLNYLKTRNLAERYHRKFSPEKPKNPSANSSNSSNSSANKNLERSYKSEYLNVNITEHKDYTRGLNRGYNYVEGYLNIKEGDNDDASSSSSYNVNKPEDGNDLPVRDSSSIKSVKYGPGHEKYPSWPGSVQEDVVDGPPHRSNSWTDQTNYKKEKVTQYVRPHNKRTNQTFTQQLKTVLERSEKISAETFDSKQEKMDERGRLYLPKVDREGKTLGDVDYMVPSPPERDKPTLTPADLEKYYHEVHGNKIDNGDYSTPYEDLQKTHLTKADLEEYARSYDESLKPFHHQQGSYAQSEGYHSYVSSSDLTTTTTPFLDRLRRESDAVSSKTQQWDDEGPAGRDSVVTTSSGSASSSETLKWHGSMSDVSIASSSRSSRQQIAHSARVAAPQRHHSESILYLGAQGTAPNVNNPPSWNNRPERIRELKLFPLSTYTVQPTEQPNGKQVVSPTSMPQTSVAERISELERQQQAHRFTYYDPEKKCRVSDPTLKAIQKKALLNFYERHQHSNIPGPPPQHQLQQPAISKKSSSQVPTWKSEPQLQTIQQMSFTAHSEQATSAPPQPPPRPDSTTRQITCGPVIIGPSISIDDWVPERPPKKPHLRNLSPASLNQVPVPPDREVEASFQAYQRLQAEMLPRYPTPDLPPPSPPPVAEGEVLPCDDPLPPPPTEVEWLLATAVPRRFSPDETPKPKEVLGMLIEPEKQKSESFEIQYDPDALNAIMESNKHRRKSPSKMNSPKLSILKEQKNYDEHIENRPPLPLPREVCQPHENTHKGCENTKWRQYDHNIDNENNFPNEKKLPELTRDKGMRSSGRYPSKLSNHSEEVQKHKMERSCSMSESRQHSVAPKVTRNEQKTRTKEGTGQALAHGQGPKLHILGSNSKAAYLAVRREKELGITNFEGSYKLTMSPSGESIETRNEKRGLDFEMYTSAINESNTNIDSRLTPLEPPDLIPKINNLNLNKKSNSVQDVRKHEYYRNTHAQEKYRMLPRYCDDRSFSYERTIVEEHVEIDKRKSLSQTNLMNEKWEIDYGDRVKSTDDVRDEEKEPEVVKDVKDVEANNVSIVISKEENQTSTTWLNSEAEDDKLTVNRVDDDDCLKLVERSTSFGKSDVMTIVSRTRNNSDVVTETNDASSQTEVIVSELDRRKMEEDLEYERLSRDLASQLSPSDRLQGLLAPAQDRKKPTDYVAGLFRLDLTSRPRRRQHKNTTTSTTSSSSGSSVGTSCSSSPDHSLVNGQTMTDRHTNTVEPLPSSSPYFTTSESKAKLLTLYSPNLESLPVKDSVELHQKKEELISRLDRKLEILRDEQVALTEECTANEDLGQGVSNQVSRLARPHEASKYRLHVKEVGKITSLLLGLSGRLARAENALIGLPVHHVERKIHESKRDKLEEQLVEAKQLKENIDRRSECVAAILSKYLTNEDYEDYNHFIHMKAKLIVDAREIADKIALGEEQLAALKETLSHC